MWHGDMRTRGRDLLGVLVADPRLVDEHLDAARGVGGRERLQVLAVLGVGLETHLERRNYIQTILIYKFLSTSLSSSSL